MLKSEIKFCPWEPCGVVLKAEDVSDITYGEYGDEAIHVKCQFCGGQYMIQELQPPMSVEDVEKKFNSIPLTKNQRTGSGNKLFKKKKN